MAGLALTFPVFYCCAIKGRSSLNQHDILNILFLGKYSDECDAKYDREYQGMTERFAELEKRLKNIEAEGDRRKIQRSAMTGFLKTLETTQAPIVDFTPQLWNALVEKAIVNADGSVVFTFRTGLTIRQNA